MDRFVRLWQHPLARALSILTLVVLLLGSGAAVAGRGRTAQAAPSGCQLNAAHGSIQHVIYLQFDNVHFTRTNPNVPSDLEQMPHLLNFLEDNGVLLTNHHTPLISHTADDILTSLTGLYPNHHGVPVANSYDYFDSSGVPHNTSAFKYWPDPVDGSTDSLPNMITTGQKNTPAPWVPFTRVGCDVGAAGTANLELENANAITILAGPTSLAANANVGDTNIKVNSVKGFTAGQTIGIDAGASFESDTIAPGGVGTPGATGTGLTLTNPLIMAHTAGVRVYAYTVNSGGDITTVFGAGSPEWNEARDSQSAPSGTAQRGLAQTDFVGIAIHCAQTSASKCSGNPNARADALPDEPNGYSGFQALYGTKYVDPAIAGGACVNDTAGAAITDPDNQCGFPGFDGMLAKNTLGYLAQMQESGVPITYGYISDAHDVHVPSTATDSYQSHANGPGEVESTPPGGYEGQLQAYDAAFAAFFQNLAAHGIDQTNTLFIITADENDHFAGGAGTPAGCDGVTTACSYTHTTCTTLSTCPANQLGEVDANIRGLLAPDYPGGVPAFDIHFDDAPTFYVNSNPGRTDPNLRTLERNVGALTSLDPYVRDSNGNVQTINLTAALADTVEEQNLHLINADPARTPNFTLFANPDFFFETFDPCTISPGPPPVTVSECVNSGFAWNHGDFQPDIVTTWLGMVGPGVAQQGVDSTTWSDHTDIRPTILALLGLKDDYSHDGRVLLEDVEGGALPFSLRQKQDTLIQLGAVYKQLDASVGQFGLDTLHISTVAVASGSASDDTTYTRLESDLTNFGSQRDALASQIITMLEQAEFNNQPINQQQAQNLINQGQALLAQVHAEAQRV
jgi:hypothetical protein